MRERKDIKGVLAKRSVMTFFSDPSSQHSHRVRVVLAEKGVTVDLIEIDPREYPAELAEINPYCNLPTLVDRDLVLFESKIMMEYLDERFPHPPLMPVYPVARGECRQYMYRIERDWCARADFIADPGSNDKAVVNARRELLDEFISIAPLFGDKPFFMSEEFSLVDCCLAAMLWRLPLLGIQLPNSKQTKPLHDYMSRMFARESFRASLSDAEKDLRRR
ncbi:MAG: glutathione S-transferase N-terminal domain-containing protein [Gammaproteobacteria bacterium]|jgi:RNA polymerase-associated protein|nr:glutathione S-transferase N-terminal domain-containing protein [Gammaproteobacteria bacterium]MBK6584710.1 glutathione S-transferase N-terminal domain-containing protein [Gammaproteobacteria bacterium]MBK7171043.1 glutathione S-transferase N-terminal domain-containing protein [Gammaproteobacteria bacterium]MBK7519781.1 glutathione S-transferase N-terminal domain-containing protein [Gammaproteobacteria bacterium]MBK7730973.1 glutathione S-transferase N-terminal domain-containing protein [Gamm